MTAPRRFFVENGVYHTISVTRGRKPLLSNEQIAEAILESINQSRAEGKVLVLAYALLPDHMHLHCVPCEGHTISDVMKAVKRGSAKAVNKAKLCEGPLWQQSFYDRVLRDEEHLNATVDYIHRNPVVAGLAKDPTDHRFSSAHPDASTDVERFFGA